jgi:uncharacterized membrane protein
METVAPEEHDVPIRHVTIGHPFLWLRDGYADFIAHPLPSLAYGALVALLGALVLAYQRHPLFIASALLGFLLVGPIFSAGLCELSRLRSLGQPTSFEASLQVLSRCRGQLLTLAFLLLLLAVVWFAISLAVLYALEGNIGPSLESTVWGDVMRALTPTQMLVYAGSGLVLCIGGFLLTVISVPLIIDHHLSATEAMRTSVRTARCDILPMLIWAAIVALLAAVGFATWLLGLVVIFPFLGHATWSVYKDLVPEE